MHQITWAIFLLLAALTPVWAQSAVASQRLNFAYTFGRPDYVDLSALGTNVFPAEVAEPMINARNLKSFAINYRGWRLLDEYIVDPEFFWELDPISLKGKIRTVNFARISKYPSLAARYRAIRPTGVNFITCVDLDSSADDAGSPSVRWSVHQVCFRAQSYQMFWGDSRSARASSYPGALLGWKEGISTASYLNRFQPTDNSDVARLKNIVSRFRTVSRYSGLAVNTWLDIRWPDGAIDKIYDDFQEYEREGRDLERRYREAKTEPTVAPRQQRLAAGDEMAQPFEDVPRVAQYFSAGGVVGLNAPNGRQIFRSTDYADGGPFGKDGKFFWFRIKGRDSNRDREVYHILDARGRRMSVGGYDAFTNLHADGSHLFVDTDEVIRTTLVNVYYTLHSNYLRLADIDLARAIEQERRTAERIRSGAQVQGQFTTSPARWIRAFKLIVDGDFKLVAKEEWFFTTTVTNP